MTRIEVLNNYLAAVGGLSCGLRCCSWADVDGRWRTKEKLETVRSWIEKIEIWN